MCASFYAHIVLMLPNVFFSCTAGFPLMQVAAAVPCDQSYRLLSDSSPWPPLPFPPPSFPPTREGPEPESWSPAAHRTSSSGFLFIMIASQLCKQTVNERKSDCMVVWRVVGAVRLTHTHRLNDDKTLKMRLGEKKPIITWKSKTGHWDISQKFVKCTNNY